MLFQLCYGPEIRSIYETIRIHPGKTREQLRDQFQWERKGDILSLIDGVLSFLKDLKWIEIKEGRITAIENDWDIIKVLASMRKMVKEPELKPINEVFVTVYDLLFVQENRLFVKNLHYKVNQLYPDSMISQEKINAWKRMMEYFGLGYRIYSGFYAIPHYKLLQKIINSNGNWNGPLQVYCEQVIDPILPCVAKSGLFHGVIYALSFLHDKQAIQLMYKQDLPYSSYGPDFKWNWIEINMEGGIVYDSMLF